MRRRALLLFGGAASLAAIAGGAFAQTRKLRRIAFLAPGTQSGFARYVAAFRSGLKELGYVEGQNIELIMRWANDRLDSLPRLVAEVIAVNPEVIVTASSAAVAACQKATTSIPIVFATAGDPVEQGFVRTLQRPGGNVTGVLVYSDIYPKMVEIIREALPAASRLGIVLHEVDPYREYVLRQFNPAAQRFKFEPLVVRVARPEDLEGAFADLARQKADAVIIPTLAFFASNQKQAIALGVKQKLALFSSSDNFAIAGGLLTYGPPREENYRRAAALVDKILRGAKPAEMPVEQPERFQLHVNLRTAAAIGVKLSQVTMFRADRVID